MWPLRVVTTIVTVQVFAQAALAGGFLSGHYGALQSHELNGLLLAADGVLLPVSAALAWRWTHRRGALVLAALVAYLSVLLQLILGFTRSLAVHIPLGVLLAIALAFLCRSAWTPGPASQVSGPRSTS